MVLFLFLLTPLSRYGRRNAFDCRRLSVITFFGKRIYKGDMNHGKGQGAESEQELL